MVTWKKVSFIIGGTADCSNVPTAAPGATAVPPYCYSGETNALTVAFFHTNMVNPVINMLHEIGHVMDNVWQDYFTTELKNTTFTDEKGQFLAGWDGKSYHKLNMIDKDNYVRVKALKAPMFQGADAWQQRGDRGYPWNEDWADIFSNYFTQNINQNDVLGSQMLDFVVKMENHVKGIQ